MKSASDTKFKLYLNEKVKNMGSNLCWYFYN